MSRLKNLLQGADPIRHEALPPDAERERIRRAMLGVTPSRPPTASRRVRLPLAATVAMIVMGIIAFGYLGWVHGTTPVSAAVRFEVRLAEDRPVPGLLVAQTSDPRRLIYLHPEIVVSNDDIAQSWVIDDGTGRFSVSVQFLPSGAERMRQATEAHLGRPLAVLIDGRVVMAPVVRSPIADSAVISGGFPRAEADRLVDGINQR